jgi:hypothetical protein
MTRIAVAPQVLQALATSMANVADDVSWTARQGAELSWSVGDGASQGALPTLLSDFEHQRLVLDRTMSSLSARLRVAGVAYAELDATLLGGTADDGGGS